MQQIYDAITSLQKGQVIILPTDTVYALACSSDKPEAIKKIYEIKKREANKNLQIFVSDIDMAHKYALIDARQENLITINTPGPFTFILPNKNTITTGLFSLDTIGIRFAPSKFLHDIISKLDQPIIATSCNISGEKDPTKIDEISSHILEKVDLIIDTGKTYYSHSSCVVDISDYDTKILRSGPIDFKHD